jgi:cation diffusion facilitator CzcD-associated flavoprotein CzcO
MTQPGHDMRERESGGEVRQGNWDVIVIGSGMGGMVTSAALARLGHNVLMLEQYQSLGGQTHSFSRDGFSWDAEIHYLGGFGPDESERSILEWLCQTPKDGQVSRCLDQLESRREPAFGTPLEGSGAGRESMNSSKT